MITCISWSSVPLRKPNSVTCIYYDLAWRRKPPSRVQFHFFLFLKASAEWQQKALDYLRESGGTMLLLLIAAAAQLAGRFRWQETPAALLYLLCSIIIRWRKKKLVMMFRHSRLSLLLPRDFLSWFYTRCLARLLCFPNNVILYKYIYYIM